jgi:hypothetical protein
VITLFLTFYFNSTVKKILGFHRAKLDSSHAISECQPPSRQTENACFLEHVSECLSSIQMMAIPFLGVKLRLTHRKETLAFLCVINIDHDLIIKTV